MIKDKLFENYLNDINQTFEGWDFSFVTETGRLQNELLSWSYGSIVRPLIQTVNSMLDMGTGGGEFLSMLRPFPKSIIATEAYKPNVSIAQRRLEPLGVKVVELVDEDNLPFETAQFDLIINRHEYYSPKELRRILADNGSFITQQVGGLDCSRINEIIGSDLNHEYFNWNLKNAVGGLEQNGFRITLMKEEFPIQRFFDIGALVYYLKAIPWQVPDFRVDKYMDGLYQVHKLIQRQGYFDAKQHRFLIKAELT
ncbi:class I SAM-dependent methyltransferase [Oceanobacillus bengalensis]|uniref:Class I SAM-dependent methyltransferase n=1 Tax=Oceanobacillus bengalensis TaxID=1435466 RepID=A0A494YUG8_9BACI|nr:class I SAM-dependent methyltransferase [Oceanobacillus bengalensis]RKQ13658.1 class I SAM-dependent methyltransferase [Oceanobacillus bengalensis]